MGQNSAETAKRVLPLAIDIYLHNFLIKFITKFGNKYYSNLPLSSQTGEAFSCSCLPGSSQLCNVPLLLLFSEVWFPLLIYKARNVFTRVKLSASTYML